MTSLLSKLARLLLTKEKIANDQGWKCKECGKQILKGEGGEVLLPENDKAFDHELYGCFCGRACLNLYTTRIRQRWEEATGHRILLKITRDWRTGE